jgi:hypothetical protein
MSITKPPYPAQFRQQMVELVQVGRSASELTREFWPSRHQYPDPGAQGCGPRTNRSATPHCILVVIAHWVPQGVSRP